MGMHYSRLIGPESSYLEEPCNTFDVHTLTLIPTEFFQHSHHPLLFCPANLISQVSPPSTILWICKSLEEFRCCPWHMGVERWRLLKVTNKLFKKYEQFLTGPFSCSSLSHHFKCNKYTIVRKKQRGKTATTIAATQPQSSVNKPNKKAYQRGRQNPRSVIFNSFHRRSRGTVWNVLALVLFGRPGGSSVPCLLLSSSSH